MPQRFFSATKKYFKSLGRMDWFMFAALFGVLSLILGAEVYQQSKKPDWWSLEQILNLIIVEVFNSFLILTIFFVFCSTVIRYSTKSSKDKSWRYMAIVAFSIVGSVVVALFTSEDSFELPHIWALAIALMHFGYWCWHREHIETSQYQSAIKSTTESLERLVNTMPNEIAFKVMGKDTSSIFGTLSMLSKMSQLASGKDNNAFIADKSKDQIKKALESMCQIASLWTVSKARLFEANIMLVKSSNEAHKIPDAKQAFERGKYFFPDLTTLNNVSDMCGKVLYTLPELAINNEKDIEKVSIEPLMLPVELLSKTHPGTIKGAPESVETGITTSIEDINEIVTNLPANYVDKQKQQIEAYFDKQVNCGSILSVPLAIVYSPEEEEIRRDEENDEQVTNNVTVDAVINLYRPEKGLIKSPELFQEFTRPLVLMIANLLYLYITSTSNAENVDTSMNSSTTKSSQEVDKRPK